MPDMPAKKAAPKINVSKLDPNWLVALLLGCFFVIFTAISLHRFWQYATWYYDFGIFYQAISSVAQGKEPIIDHFVFEGKNILGDHFHPIIFLISPLLWIFPHPEVLLVVQTLAVTLSGFFIYLTADKILKNKYHSLGILVIYLAFVGLHNALITEFHEIALLPLPLSIFFYSIFSRKRVLYFLSLSFVLLTKETTFIIPAFFGIYLAMKNKNWWRWAGIFTTIFSLVYGFTVIRYVMPYFSGMDYRYMREASSSFSLSKLIDPAKLQLIPKTLLSYGFLPLLAPELLPPVAANWLSRFISEGTRSDLGMHYNAEVAPTLALASAIGFKRLRKLWERFSLSKKRHFKQVPSLFIGVVAVFSLFASIVIFNSPARLAFNRAFFEHTKNLQFLDQLLAHVPEDGTVMAQHNLAGKLADRQVFILRDKYWNYQPDYIVIDTRDGQEPNNFLGIKNFDKLVERLENDPQYELHYDQGEQRIYRRL